MSVSPMKAAPAGAAVLAPSPVGGASLIDQLFGDLLSPIGGSLFDEDPFFAALGTRTRFSPATNIVESETAYTITFEVPGVTAEALSVTYDRGVLNVTGTIDLPSVPAGATARYVERVTGSFARAFRLPETVNDAQITAALANGILTVTVPKNPEARSAITVPIRTAAVTGGQAAGAIGTGATGMGATG